MQVIQVTHYAIIVILLNNPTDHREDTFYLMIVMNALKIFGIDFFYSFPNQRKPSPLIAVMHMTDECTFSADIGNIMTIETPPVQQYKEFLPAFTP